MDHTFDTPAPIEVFVETGRGLVEVTAADTGTTTVDITGERADEFDVTFHGNRLDVVAPRPQGGFFSRDPRATVTIEVPTGSRLAARTGSSDVRAHGQLEHVWTRTGSGDVTVDEATGEVDVQTGSGDVVVHLASGETHVKTGSGDVRLEHVAAATVVATGSGDVKIDVAFAEVALKTGSGDAQVDRLSHDLVFTTGSGDLRILEAERGNLTLKAASGDLHVGIPAGTPVWTDLTTASGQISSDLPATGEPADGQDHVEIRGRTASGSITLHAR